MDNLKRQLLRGARANTPAFFYVVIIRRRAWASSPVRQRKVVSNKLFPKIRRLCSELLEIRENEPNGNANLEMKDGKKNYFIKDI